MRIYLTGPVRSEADREWQERLASRLQTAGFDVIRGCDLEAHTPAGVLALRLEAVLASRAAVVVLDGLQADGSAAFEAGYAFARGIPVYGVAADGTVLSGPFAPEGGVLRGRAGSRAELVSMLLAAR